MHRRCNGSVVKRTLGPLDALTVEDARHTVRALLVDAEETRTPAAVPTVRTFAPAFPAVCAERWKPATRQAHADGVNRFILPAFGDRRVDAGTAKDVRYWCDELSAARTGPANRALAVPSLMMKHAEALGLRREDSNPCNPGCAPRVPRGTPGHRMLVPMTTAVRLQPVPVAPPRPERPRPQRGP